MKKTLVTILILAMLGILFPAVNLSMTANAVGVSPPAPANLIVGTQGTFEDATLPYGWSVFSGGTLSLSSSIAHSGSKSICLNNRAQTWYSPTYNIYDVLKKSGAGTYTIGFWVYTDTLSSSPKNGNLMIRGGSSADINSFITDHSGSYYGYLKSSISTALNTWTLYSASLTVLDTDLTRDTGTFNLMIDGLEASASQKLYIDDLQIVRSPDNMVTGTTSTFETGSVPTGWTTFSGGSLTTSTTTAHSGSYSLKMTSRTYAWTSPTYNIYSILKNGGAGTYTIRLWVYTDTLSSSPKNGNLMIRGGSSADANSFITNNGGSYYGYLKTGISTAVNTWTQYSGTVNVLDSDLTRDTGTFNLMIDTLEAPANQILYFDDVQIYKSPSNGLINGLFENPMALDGWNNTAYSGSTLTQYSSDKVTGSYSLKFTRPSVNASAATDVTPIMKVNGVGKYLLTFSAKLDTTATGTEPINAYITNGANEITALSGTISKDYWTKFSAVVDIDSTKLSQQTGSGTSYLHFKGASSGQTTTAFLIDDVNFTFPTDATSHGLLANGGFEYDTTSWTSSNCSLSMNNQIKNTGTYSLFANNRSSATDVPKQDITSILTADGDGQYMFSANVRLAEGYASAKAQIVVHTLSSDASEHWYTTPYMTLTAANFTKIENALNVEWSATLTSAEFYVQFDSSFQNSTAAFYLDDCSMTDVSYDPSSVDYEVERWRALEIPFTSAYDTSLITGVQSTFEQATVPTGWSAFSGGTVSTSTTVAHSGSYSLKLAGRTQAWYAPQYNIYSLIKSAGAGTYNIGFWVYVDAQTTNPSNGRILIRGTSANQYSFFTSGQSYGPVGGSTSTATNTWTYYSGNLVVTDTDISQATGTFNLMIDSLPGLTGQNLYFDDISIKKLYTDAFNDVTMDVTFTGPNSTTMVMPAFWDGGNTWKVRFAPNYPGTWSYTTTCSNTADTGLHNLTGTIGCSVYTGNLEIYKRGFVKTTSGLRYFTYDDGSPFFYIGDTHWSMPAEPYSTMFQPLVDQRVTKGFTVYQSEPIGVTYNLTNGLTSADLTGFADLDNRFAYIANAGLVHANAQLFYSSELQYNGAYYSTAYLQKLSRYWVARYSSYPVMWTTAQEVDDDFYGVFDIATSPWKTVFNAIHQYDPYVHPQTAHQENTSHTQASDSAYKDLAGYSWFGSQWTAAKNASPDFSVASDYWNNGGARPAVVYEGCYENLWTNEFGARQQGWTAFLNGMYGHGYGAQDIWDYNTTYNEDVDSTVFGITITIAMKAVTWETSKDFNTPYQLGTYMQGFFSNMNWYELVPRFSSSTWFSNNSSYYSVASKDNDVYVAYFYNPTTNTGTLKNMDNENYTAKWYNPTTGAYTTIGTITPTSGQWTIPSKPDNNDWVLYVYK